LDKYKLHDQSSKALFRFMVSLAGVWHQFRGLALGSQLVLEFLVVKFCQIYLRAWCSVAYSNFDGKGFGDW